MPYLHLFNSYNHRSGHRLRPPKTLNSFPVLFHLIFMPTISSSRNYAYAHSTVGGNTDSEAKQLALGCITKKGQLVGAALSATVQGSGRWEKVPSGPSLLGWMPMFILSDLHRQA